MNIINGKAEIVTPSSQEEWVREAKYIELVARNCYKSEDKITEDSYKKFIKMLKDNNHHAMIEFGRMIVKLTTDRGILAELTRHRLASYAVESTRYCNYSKDKFNNEITVVRPSLNNKSMEYALWEHSCRNAEKFYFDLLGHEISPQLARSVLPNSLKTEIYISCNFREWMHIFKLRCISKAAHPDFRQLLKPLYKEVREILPEVFDLGDME